MIVLCLFFSVTVACRRLVLVVIVVVRCARFVRLQKDANVCDIHRDTPPVTSQYYDCHQ